MPSAHCMPSIDERKIKQRQSENANRVATANSPTPLPILALSTGINTGSATVGLMGSDATILNYTVFGREVNLASRLEGASGRGRILIGPATSEELRNLDPELAERAFPTAHHP